MFVQVITGRTSDADGVRRQMDRWRHELRTGATGFLGSTSGVADDGSFVALARFADADAAARNSARAEQGEWWEETSKYFDGEVTFRESTDTDTIFDGPTTSAGFVQVMEGTVADRAKARSFETPEMLEQLRAARPDLLGSLRVWFDGGSYVEAAYFTSEEAARAGETSDDFAGPQAEYVALFGDMTFTDLRDPMHA
jgi:hypothetical protein